MMPEYEWDFGEWSTCTTTCGGGTQRWWAGPWQPCSKTCGSDGEMRRSVLCVQAHGAEMHVQLAEKECDGMLRPIEKKVCTNEAECPPRSDWLTGKWSDNCNGNNPCAYKKRRAWCSSSNVPCSWSERPTTKEMCDNETCANWSKDKANTPSSDSDANEVHKRISPSFTSATSSVTSIPSMRMSMETRASTSTTTTTTTTMTTATTPKPPRASAKVVQRKKGVET